MIILDTNYLTILEWPESPVAMRVRDRLSEFAREQVATTIISFEEQTRGWLSALKKAKHLKDQISKYRKLNQMVQQYCSIFILDFDERAAIEFQRLKKNKIRVGTMDLKIAAIALAFDAVLLTQNEQDFRIIPGLKIEDWTKE